jgi:hypothetical protein
LGDQPQQFGIGVRGHDSGKDSECRRRPEQSERRAAGPVAFGGHGSAGGRNGGFRNGIFLETEPTDARSIAPEDLNASNDG